LKKNSDKEIAFINDNYNKRFSENKEIKNAIPEIKIFEVDNYSENSKTKIQDIFNEI
jgi:hypothetical protein